MMKQKNDQTRKQHLKAVVEEVNEDYQNYLIYLEQKNKHHILLREQSLEAKRKEKLEQGFNLFFNLPPPDIHRKQADSRHFKSLGEWNDKSAKTHDVCRISNKSRTNSAPITTKCTVRRKTWGSVVVPQCSYRDNYRSGSSITTSERRTKSIGISEMIPWTEHKFPAVKQDGINISDSQNTPLNIQTHVLPDYVNVESEQSIYSVSPLLVYVDILDNWGDCNLVGLHNVQLVSPLFSSVAVCSIQEIKIFHLNNDGQVEKECFPTDISQNFVNSGSKSEEDCIWKTAAQSLPLRLSIKFHCPSQHDLLRFQLRNCTCTDNWCRISVNRIRLELVYPSEKSYLTEARLKPRELFEVQINMREELAYIVKTTENQIHKDNHAILKTYDQSNNSCSPNSVKRLFWLPDEADPVKKKTFLEQVSSELLENNFSEVHKKYLDSSHVQTDLLFDSRCSSLDFYDHLYAEKLTTAMTHLSEKSNQTEHFDHQDKKVVPVSYQNVSPKDNEILIQAGDWTQEIVCPPRPTDLAVSIPELPQGRVLTLDIVSNWGDTCYVGLTGLEMFNSDGIDVAPLCHIFSDPVNINNQHSNGTDQRVVANLIDGVNWTRDEEHMWLAPFTPGARNLIRLLLPNLYMQIAMIRLWNYNKSRVHTSCGVKDLIIYLDNKLLFYGEINRALDLDSTDPNDFCETILFTTDDTILELIATNDHVIKLYRTTQSTQDTEKIVSAIKQDRSMMRVTPPDLTQFNSVTDENQLTDFITELHINETEREEQTKLLEIELC